MTLADLNCDLSQLHRLADGDMDFAAELLAVFQHDTAASLGKLRTAIQQRELQNVREIAHYLKGSSANLGFHSFTQQAKLLEQQAKQGNLSEGDRILIQLEYLFQQFVDCLQPSRSVQAPCPLTPSPSSQSTVG